MPDLPGPDATVYAKKLSDEERKGKRVWALVKQDGQSIKKTWNPSPETEYTLELDATFSF